MNIGIDVDGVLTDIHNFNLRHAPPYFKENYNRNVVDENCYDIRDMFKCPDDEFEAYWKEYLLKYVTTEPARSGVKETIRKLREDGHNIFIITKRVFTCSNGFLGKLMRFILRNWLWFYKVYHDEIVFCDNDIPDSKKDACIAKHIDLMVDDEPVNINTIAPVTKVICFDTSYNHDCDGKNIIRAYNWEDVYKIIKDTSAQND